MAMIGISNRTTRGMTAPRRTFFSQASFIGQYSKKRYRRCHRHRFSWCRWRGYFMVPLCSTMITVSDTTELLDVNTGVNHRMLVTLIDTCTETLSSGPGLKVELVTVVNEPQLGVVDVPV